MTQVIALVALQRIFSEAWAVRIRAGKEYVVEVGFDGESVGRVTDCRPALPLVLRW